MHDRERRGWARVGRAAKRILVALATLFFLALGGLLWAVQTGRAAVFVRNELVAQLREQCAVDGRFDAIELGLLPPQIYLRDIAVTDEGGKPFVSVEEAILRVSVLPLFYGRIQVAQAAALAPRGKLHLEDGRLVNLPRCLVPSGGGGPIPALGVDELRVERGHFELQLGARARAVLSDIGVDLQPGRAGGTDLAVGLDDGKLFVDGREIVLQRFRLLAHVSGLLTSPRALSLRRLELGLDGVSLTGSGAIDLLGPVVDAQVDADVDLAALRRLVPELPELRGRARLSTKVAGLVASPRAVGSLAVDRGFAAGFGLGDRLELGFRADSAGVDLDRIWIALADGRVEGKGRLDLDEAGRYPVRASVDVSSLSLARVIEALGFDGPWVDYRGTGRIDTSGHLLGPFGLSGSVSLDVRDMVVFDRAWDAPDHRDASGRLRPERVLLSLGPTELSGRWSADALGISLPRVALRRGSTRGITKARFSFDERPGIRIEGDLESFDFADLGPIAGLRLGGVGSIFGRISGPYSKIGADGSFTLQDASVGGIPFGDGHGAVRWRGDTIFVDSIEGRLGKSAYNGDLRIDFDRGARLGLSGAITKGRIEDLLIPFGVDGKDYGDPKGELRGSFDLQGTVDALTGPIDLELGAWSFVDEKGERGRVIGRMESGTLVAESAELHKHGARISASGWIDPATRGLRLRARTTGMTLQRIDTMKAAHEGVDGRLLVHADLGGRLDAMTGTVTAELAAVGVGELPLGGGVLRGRVRGRTIYAQGTILGDRLAVDGEVDLERGIPYRARLELRPYDTPRLVGELLGIPGFTGVMSGKARLHGGLVDWARSDGELSLDRLLVDARGFKLETSAPVKLGLEDGVFSTTRMVLVGPTTRLAASGRMSTRLLDLGVQGRIDLALVESVFPPVERSGGVLTLDAAIRGSSKGLDLLGTGRVERGLVIVKGLQSKLSGATAELTFSQSTVIVERVEGRLDGGRATARGQIALEGFLPSRVSFDLEVADVRPRYTQPKFDLSSVLNGAIRLEGPIDRIVARGEVVAKRTVIVPKLDWRNLVGDPMQRLVPKVYDPTAERLHFGILVRLADPLRMRNDTADVRMSGDVTLTGTNQRMGMTGSLSVLDGRVGVLGREYQFESGAIELSERDRFYPRYDLVLNANACGARITLNLVGTLDDFDTTYSSKPDMSDTNIVSCLVRGVKIRDLETVSDDALGGVAASFAGEALWRLSGVDRQVKKVLPVDLIDITTAYSTRERVYEPRVLIAKEILDGRVRLEFSSSLFNTDDQSITARYRVTPELTVQSGWTSSEDIQVGDLGVDLKYRWEW